MLGACSIAPDPIVMRLNSVMGRHWEHMPSHLGNTQLSNLINTYSILTTIIPSVTAVPYKT
jgi:hypothetical protein